MHEHPLFWGEIHTHTALREGNGRPEDNFEIAKSHLDFWAMADHAYDEAVFDLDYRESGPDRHLLNERWEHVQDLCLEAVRHGWLRSAHDVSEGGLAVSLAESAFHSRSGLGCRVELEEDFRADALLFGETQSRIIATVAMESLDRLLELSHSRGVEARSIGRTGGDRIVIRRGGEILIDVLVREAYQRRQQELGDSIALVESRADSIEAAADRRAESLAHEVASTRALLRDAQADDADAATVRLALRFADSTIVALEAELEARQQLTIELRGLVALERQRADNAEARIGILEGLLEEGQKVSQCRIAGFIPCPSRGLVAVVAFVGGAFSYAALGP